MKNLNLNEMIENLETEKTELIKNAMESKMDRKERKNLVIPFKRKIEILKIIEIMEEFETTKDINLMNIDWSYLKNDEFFNGLSFFLETTENKEYLMLNKHIELNTTFNQQISLLRD